MKKVFIKFLIIFFGLFPLATLAETSSRTGFVDGTVWYSVDEMKEGDSIRIYAAVFNGEKSNLKGSVNFLDDRAILGTREIDIKPGETATISIPWTVEVGSHDILAKLEDTKNESVVVVLTRHETKHSRFSVTKDVSIDNAKSALTAQVGSLISLDNTGIDFTKVDVWLDQNFKQVETFRKKNFVSFEIKKSKVKRDNAENENAKTPVKILSTMHFLLLSLLVLVFSITILFYLVILILMYFVLRIIWRLLKRLFRKKYEE